MRHMNWMTGRHWSMFAFGVVALWAAASAVAIESDECSDPTIEPTTPSEDFTAIEEGEVVRHERTGLEWWRCSEGMAWNAGDGSCEGDADEMTWQEALEHAADKDDWRLPDINELRSIVERCSEDLAINGAVFPDTARKAYVSRFWSSSPYHGDASDAWQVDFVSGRSDDWGKNLEFYVRLVRDGQ